jgi:hypothetical protein
MRRQALRVHPIMLFAHGDGQRDLIHNGTAMICSSLATPSWTGLDDTEALMPAAAKP